jgi:hypothetical protein
MCAKIGYTRNWKALSCPTEHNRLFQKRQTDQSEKALHLTLHVFGRGRKSFKAVLTIGVTDSSCKWCLGAPGQAGRN